MNTIQIRYHKFWRSCVAMTLLSVTPGCAVLTQSQIDEVRTFARATDNYGTLPGAVIQTYGDVRLASASLNATLAADASSAATLVSDVQSQRRHQALAARADAAMQAIDTYAELLLKLTSEEYTANVDKEATSLGRSIDALAKQAGASNSSIGSAVGSGVDFLGRVWIRHRQAQLIQQSVKAANPVIPTLTHAITEAMTSYVALSQSSSTAPEPGSHAPLLAGERETLTTHLRNIIAARKGEIPLAVVQLEIEAIRNTYAAEDLARFAHASALAYQAAHEKLASALLERTDIISRIEEIHVLTDQIKAANQVRKALQS